MEEIMNTEVVNDVEVQEAVVEPQTEPVEEPEVVNEQPKVQSREQNRQQAAMRRSRESELQRQIETLMAEKEAERAEKEALMEAVGGYGYKGKAKEMAGQIKAAQQGIPYEEYQRQQDQDKARYKEMMQNDPDYLAVQQKADFYEREVIKQLMKDDLAAINKAFPEAKIKSLQELGDDYLNLIGAGVSPLAAYTAVGQAQEATKKPVPPVMGALNKTPAEKDFYTSEEVDEIYKNHPELANDPKTAEIIRNSMTRW